MWNIFVWNKIVIENKNHSQQHQSSNKHFSDILYSHGLFLYNTLLIPAIHWHNCINNWIKRNWPEVTSNGPNPLSSFLPFPVLALLQNILIACRLLLPISKIIKFSTATKSIHFPMEIHEIICKEKRKLFSLNNELNIYSYIFCSYPVIKLFFYKNRLYFHNYGIMSTCPLVALIWNRRMNVVHEHWWLAVSRVEALALSGTTFAAIFAGS